RLPSCRPRPGAAPAESALPCDLASTSWSSFLVLRGPHQAPIPQLIAVLVFGFWVTPIPEASGAHASACASCASTGEGDRSRSIYGGRFNDCCGSQPRAQERWN